MHVAPEHDQAASNASSYFTVSAKNNRVTIVAGFASQGERTAEDDRAAIHLALHAYIAAEHDHVPGHCSGVFHSGAATQYEQTALDGLAGSQGIVMAKDDHVIQGRPDGAGSINYFGSPVVHERVNGIGSFQKAGD